MKAEDKIEKEIIDGKPHFGIWVGVSMIVANEIYSMDIPIYQEALAELKNQEVLEPYGLEGRQETVILQPTCNNLNATLGIKRIVWGRAYKVHAYHRKITNTKNKKFKKVWLNNKRKNKRVF